MPAQITVLESLAYSARLRFSKTVSTDIVYSFVQEAGFEVLPLSLSPCICHLQRQLLVRQHGAA